MDSILHNTDIIQSYYYHHCAFDSNDHHNIILEDWHQETHDTVTEMWVNTANDYNIFKYYAEVSFWRNSCITTLLAASDI